MNIEIANRLVNLRKSNNLSQEALAEKLGISRQAVSKWERAEASPDTDNLILLARLYGVSLDELLKTEDEIPMPEPFMAEEKDSLIEEYTELESWGAGSVSDEEPPKENDKGWHTFVRAVERRNPSYFAYPVFVTLVFLCLGTFGSWWHPGWVVFLTIPLYYSLIEWFRDKGKREQEDWKDEE